MLKKQSKMYKSIICLVFFLIFCGIQEMLAQKDSKNESELVQKRKNRIILEEKSLLKIEVLEINDRLKKNEISEKEAIEMKEIAAKKRAMNIQNKISILENQVAVFERNNPDSLEFIQKYSSNYGLQESYSWLKNSLVRSINSGTNPQEVKYDRRTYSDPVFGFGFNMASLDGSFKDSPYINFGAFFTEFGWSWRTRVFEKSNFMRFHYGLSLQNNPLEYKYSENYVVINGESTLQEFDFPLTSGRLKRTNLVVPIYFEFGPSKVTTTKNSIRYSLKKQFRIGIGAYAGINLSTKQKLKYFDNDIRTKVKQINGFNTEKSIYGLNAYIGFDDFLVYMKYDLNPIFQDTEIKQRNFSIGFRSDL